MQKHIKNYELMFKYIQSAFTYETTAKLYVGGQSNLLMQPEFQDVEKVYDFYTMLEDEEELIRLFCMNIDLLQVKIGNVYKVDTINQFNFITPYYMHNLK